MYHIIVRVVVILLILVVVYVTHKVMTTEGLYKELITERLAVNIQPAVLFDQYRVNWDKIELRKRKDNITHDKWIVITTINPPTSDVKKLAAIKGWRVVIVGDTKSPKDWKYPNCIHLFVEDQLKLGYRSTHLIKFKSYARKNIGFLYAIEHGAKVIYETDDDNSPTKNSIGFDPESKLNYLMYHAEKGETVMNPYAHFGQNSVWPRGYPLDKIGINNTYMYRRCPGKRALVQQGVVNGDPDVDAIFRLTRKKSDVDLVIHFDSKAEPLMLPKGIMSPYNSQNTLHLYDAFWGLVLPQTVAFRVCDIWRGYWAQRLLWEIDGHLTFFPPNAFTVRNAHSFLEDFIDEKDLYHKSSSFVQFLVDWTSDREIFFDRVMDLSIDMVKKDFWKKDDIELVKLWLIDLISLGYKAPLLKAIDSRCNSKVELIKPREQRTSIL